MVESEGRDGQVLRTDAEGRREVARERYFPAPRVVRVGTAPRTELALELLGSLFGEEA